MKKYKVIGVMSGTSLDGMDIAYCEFTEQDGKWHYEIIFAETIPYNDLWKKTLANIEKGSALEFAEVHNKYGHLTGELVAGFISRYTLSADFISSHGHTIFHQPENKFTFQIGSGAAIAAECGLPVVCDFRTVDVALGGQGAPLVPVGDRLLFSEYDFCLNLGGFANISLDSNGSLIAFDICPVNIVLNRLVSLSGKEYDANGDIASVGKENPSLISELNSLDFYKLQPPKSLGKEWVLKFFNTIIDKYNIPVQDKLRSVCSHIAVQVSRAESPFAGNKMLVTGGGAYNTFLISLLKKHCKSEIIIPDKKTIEFKEALIFAFLGTLRITGRINCFSSATGAVKDNIGGAVYSN